MLEVKTKHLHNRDLYERCEVSPLKHQIAWARWSLFGHTLRLSRDTPAQLAIDLYCNSNDHDTKSLGRATTTLPVQLFNEYREYLKTYKLRGYSSKPHMMLAKRRQLAGNPVRQTWRYLVSYIISCQIPDFSYRTDLC